MELPETYEQYLEKHNENIKENIKEISNLEHDINTEDIEQNVEKNIKYLTFEKDKQKLLKGLQEDNISKRGFYFNIEVIISDLEASNEYIRKKIQKQSINY